MLSFFSVMLYQFIPRREMELVTQMQSAACVEFVAFSCTDCTSVSRKIIFSLLFVFGTDFDSVIYKLRKIKHQHSICSWQGLIEGGGGGWIVQTYVRICAESLLSMYRHHSWQFPETAHINMDSYYSNTHFWALSDPGVYKSLKKPRVYVTKLFSYF